MVHGTCFSGAPCLRWPLSPMIPAPKCWRSHPFAECLCGWVWAPGLGIKENTPPPGWWQEGLVRVGDPACSPGSFPMGASFLGA